MGKVVWLFGGVFGGIGLLLLVFAALALASTIQFRGGAIAVEGKVIDMDRVGKSYAPIVEFTDRAGHTHRVTGNASNPPGYRRGDSATVRYAAEHPEDARIDGFMNNWFLPTILGGMGALFGSIGGGFIVWEIRKRRLRAWLRQYGMRVQATYTGVRLDTSVSVNGRHPYRVCGQWQNPVTGMAHVFESDMLFYDPSGYVTRDTIDVLVDADDPGRHHVDLAFLPKQG